MCKYSKPWKHQEASFTDSWILLDSVGTEIKIKKKKIHFHFFSFNSKLTLCLKFKDNSRYEMSQRCLCVLYCQQNFPVAPCLIVSASLFLKPHQVSEATTWSHLSHKNTSFSHRVSTEYNTKLAFWLSRLSWATMLTALLSLPSSALKITEFVVSLDNSWNTTREEVRENALVRPVVHYNFAYFIRAEAQILFGLPNAQI